MMPIYECHCCDFETDDKKEFNAHLDTEDHIANECNHCTEVVKDKLTLLEERVAALEEYIKSKM